MVENSLWHLVWELSCLTSMGMFISGSYEVFTIVPVFEWLCQFQWYWFGGYSWVTSWIYKCESIGNEENNP